MECFVSILNTHLQFILTDGWESRGRPRYLLGDVGMDAYQSIQLFVHLNLTQIHILTVVVRVALTLWFQAQDSLLVTLHFLVSGLLLLAY